MSDIRIIKKYPNRRLYDTHISSYITLSDIKKLVEGYIPFQIIASKTNEDLTRNTLLQVIMEEEERGAPIFTSELLLKTIRFYGDSTQAQISRFLEHSLQLFTEHQGELKGPMSSLDNKDRGSKLKSITEKNIERWKQKSSD